MPAARTAIVTSPALGSGTCTSTRLSASMPPNVLAIHFRAEPMVRMLARSTSALGRISTHLQVWQATPRSAHERHCAGGDAARRFSASDAHYRKVDAMSTITTHDGTSIYYKDWGTGTPIVFAHGWPLSADAWDAQMLF